MAPYITGRRPVHCGWTPAGQRSPGARPGISARSTSTVARGRILQNSPAAVDKESRSLKKRWKERQLAAARARFPLPEENLDELFASVAAALEGAECDNTLKHTRAWIAANYLPAE